jgi:hypothetical protein
MSVRYSYLALEKDHQLVVDWFAALPDEVTVSDREDRRLIYFRAMAAHPLPTEGEIDQNATPLVFISTPQRRCGTLWTDAEVLFTPTPLKSQFPALQKVNQAFAKWLKQFSLVFSQSHAKDSELKYYLEGGIQNFDAELHALPHALVALRNGQYFVHHRDSAGQLDTVCKKLRLRGFETESYTVSL